MQRVFVLAVLLLGLALAFDRELASSRFAARGQQGELDWVQVFSTARGHEPAAPLTGLALSSIHLHRIRIHERALNARGLTAASDLPGLVAGAFDLDGELVGSALFKPGVDADEVTRLVEWCSELRPDTLLLLTRRGSMTPRGPKAAEEKEQLEALFEALGCEARPWRSNTLSWAYAARRTSKGWTPVVEAASPTRGVMLSVPISPDERPTAGSSDHPGLPLLGRAQEKHRVALGLPLKNLSVDSYVLPAGRTSELTWSELELGERPRFTAFVSANESARFSSQGLVFRLLLDGVTQDSVEFRTPAHERLSWRRWEVELPESTGPCELKLVVEPLRGSQTAAPQVGAPLLSFGA